MISTGCGCQLLLPGCLGGGRKKNSDAGMSEIQSEGGAAPTNYRVKFLLCVFRTGQKKKKKWNLVVRSVGALHDVTLFSFACLISTVVKQ